MLTHVLGSEARRVGEGASEKANDPRPTQPRATVECWNTTHSTCRSLVCRSCKLEVHRLHMSPRQCGRNVASLKHLADQKLVASIRVCLYRTANNQTLMQTKPRLVAKGQARLRSYNATSHTHPSWHQPTLGHSCVNVSLALAQKPWSAKRACVSDATRTPTPC